MLRLRYSTQGKRKRRTTPEQWIAQALAVVMTLAFTWTAFRYMFQWDVRAEGQTPAPQASVSPAVTPAPTPQGQAAAPAATPRPTPTPFGPPVLTEDEEAGVWGYESESVKITVERQRPLEGVVATVAVVSPKTENVLRTAFAEGQYGRNIRARTREIAADAGAVLAINGDYCGYRDDGIIVRGGQLYRDKPARTMLALFSDGRLEVIPEKEADVEALLQQGLMESFSFGPVLLEAGELPEKFHTDVPSENPRTAIGRKENGDFVLVVADGRQSDYSRGMTIRELAQYLKDLGCTVGYNLDGGMTSAMYFNGKIISRPCGTANKERPLSDIIYVANEA